MYSPSNNKSKAQLTITQSLLANSKAFDERLGPNHPDSIAAAEKLSDHLLDIWENETAEPYLKRVCDYYIESKGINEPATLARLFQMAELQSDLEHDSEASRLYLLVLEGRMKVLGQEHPDTLESLVEYAEQLIYQEQFEQAAALYVRAVESAQKVFGPEDQKTREYQSGLAICRTMSGKKSDEPAPERKKGCASYTAMVVFTVLYFGYSVYS